MPLAASAIQIRMELRMQTSAAPQNVPIIPRTTTDGKLLSCFGRGANTNRSDMSSRAVCIVLSCVLEGHGGLIDFLFHAVGGLGDCCGIEVQHKIRSLHESREVLELVPGHQEHVAGLKFRIPLEI